ncbi:hypothetical protein DFH09DRAFT_1111836 [Mycena vulgaris]|nr:hypothetical protein DFH09DRAFT_1111836 [Mycena vulgaris]
MFSESLKRAKELELNWGKSTISATSLPGAIHWAQTPHAPAPAPNVSTSTESSTTQPRVLGTGAISEADLAALFADLNFVAPPEVEMCRIVADFLRGEAIIPNPLRVMSGDYTGIMSCSPIGSNTTCHRAASRIKELIPESLACCLARFKSRFQVFNWRDYTHYHPAFITSRAAIDKSLLSVMSACYATRFGPNFEHPLVLDQLLRHPLLCRTRAVLEGESGSSFSVNERYDETPNTLLALPIGSTRQGSKSSLPKTVYKVWARPRPRSDGSRIPKPSNSELIQLLIGMLQRNVQILLSDLGAICTITHALAEAGGEL